MPTRELSEQPVPSMVDTKVFEKLLSLNEMREMIRRANRKLGGVRLHAATFEYAYLLGRRDQMLIEKKLRSEHKEARAAGHVSGEYEGPADSQGT